MVETPDEVGELAKVLGAVADGGVNGIACAGYAESGKGYIMIVADDAGKAASQLAAAGYDVSERDVVVVRDQDVPGSAAGIAKKIAEAGISLTQMYATSAGGEYVTILQSQDADQLAAALQ